MWNESGRLSIKAACKGFPDIERVRHGVSRDSGDLVRDVSAGRYFATGRIRGSTLPADLRVETPDRAWVLAQLRGTSPEVECAAPRRLRAVDLFCGPGGFSAGLRMAARAVGVELEVAACVDLDEVALGVFRRNHRPRHTLVRNVDNLVDYSLRFDRDEATFAFTPELLEGVFASLVGRVDVVIGGPPCQGHSNLNNRTRRADPRNTLYLTVPAIGVALGAAVIVIENVPAALSDRGRVVAHAASALRARGYDVDTTVLEANRFGTAQQRKRHFLLASRGEVFALDGLYSALNMPVLDVGDAIGDLEDIIPETLFDVPADLSPENKARIDYLFDNGLYILPDAVRPDCHKDGHSYPSVYGRIYPDRPVQTITGGFLTPGRGRFVHPTRRRGLTPHEGARLQGFPDDYCFESLVGDPLFRKDYAKLIGDAVPPPLAFAVGLAAIASLP
jgi:DNA (cytosine-5)-methyltransferase 1